MSQFSEGDSAINRLTAATVAFEKVLTEPEGTLVPMPVGLPQPSMAERLKRSLDAVTVQPEQAASQAKEASLQASQSAAAAAQSAADAAGSAAATGYVAPPFPDVWAPLSDSLQLLAGVAPADTITVGGTSFPLKTKSLSFSRASTATYIDKSGVLQTAAVNEPRFEKEGLLIEGQSTNYFRYSNDPSQWKSTGNTASALNVSVINDGNTKAPTGMFTLTADSSVLTLIGHTGTPIQVAVGDVVSASCRVKIPSNCRVRVRYGNSQGYVTGIYYDSVGNRIGTEEKTTNNSVVLGSDGYLTIKSSYIVEAADANFFVSFLIYDVNNVNNNIAAGAVFYLQMPQSELYAQCTSFIPTSSSVATRAADDCSSQRSGNDNYFGPVTIAAEVHCNGQTATDGQTASRRGILSAYPSAGEYFVMMVDASVQQTGKYAFAYGGSNFNYSADRIDDGQIHTVCSRSTTVMNQSSVDGNQLTNPTAVARPTPGTVTAANQTIMIGRGAGASASGQRMLNGHIRNLRIWHRALSDIQMKGIR
ncbi:phage head spike fiber domain-containing protein [Atlantibacter hermannii]|uniref:phage head spike fiber domain-containing protein n=1 Tax=Atlantibacter hermannii TaxID=565 RepID=UPI0028A260BC|nr:LamG-like jellyroll fold domain-containing protein [Atlantibacter hermannii]